MHTADKHNGVSVNDIRTYNIARPAGTPLMLAQMLETKPNDKTYEAVLSVLWRCPTSFESTSYFVHIEDQMWAPTCRMQTINVTVCRMQTINVTVYILNVAIHFRNQMLIKKEREREKK